MICILLLRNKITKMNNIKPLCFIFNILVVTRNITAWINPSEQSAETLPKVVTMDPYRKGELTCKLDPSYVGFQETLTWQCNGTILNFNGHENEYRLRNQSWQYDLEIVNPTKKLSGIYQCVNYFNGTMNVLEFYELKVKYRVRQTDIKASGSQEVCKKYGFDRYEQCIEVEEFSNKTLWCNVTAFPQPTVEWFYNEMRLNINGTALKLINFTRECGAEYSCRAMNERNKNTPVYKTIKVITTYPPYIFIGVSGVDVSTSLHNYYDGVLVDTGQRVLLKCIVESYPPPTHVEWQLNNETLAVWRKKYLSDNDLTSQDYVNHTIVITYNNAKVTKVYEAVNVQLDENNVTMKVSFEIDVTTNDEFYGIYKCFANNSAGIDEWMFLVRRPG